MDAELVEVATELVMQGTQLQEMEQAIERFHQLINQAAQRPKVAAGNASAAVTAIGKVKTPEQKRIKLNNRDAEKFWPETYTANRVDKKSVTSSLYTSVTCYCVTTASAYTSAGPLSLKQNGVCTLVITSGCTDCPLRTLLTWVAVLSYCSFD